MAEREDVEAGMLQGASGIHQHPVIQENDTELEWPTRKAWSDAKSEGQTESESEPGSSHL